MNNFFARKYAMFFVLFAFAFSGVLSCSKENTSQITDIFNEDEGNSTTGNSRRHPANPSERLHTVRLSGCTGHLVAPELMMTAQHCSPRVGDVATSGHAENQGKRRDIKIIQIVESNSQLDYAIAKIQWTEGYPKEQFFAPKIATKKSDVLVVSSGDTGDALFTVGYPADKMNTWGATYAEGFAKGVDSQGSKEYLVYNIGIINGNSGGGVWRKSDKMLVSLTNGGPNAFGQSGWDRNNATDSNHWNNGAAMWKVYQASATLKDVFPNGINRYNETALPIETTAIFAALVENSSSADQFTLAISAPESAKSAVVCAYSSLTACNLDQVITRTTLDSSKNGRNYFIASTPPSLSDGLTLTVGLYDESAKLIGLRSIRFNKISPI